MDIVTATLWVVLIVAALAFHLDPDRDSEHAAAASRSRTCRERGQDLRASAELLGLLLRLNAARPRANSARRCARADCQALTWNACDVWS